MEQPTEERQPGKGWGCLIISIIFAALGGWAVYKYGGMHQLETTLTYVSWPYRVSLVLSVILTGILLTVRERPAAIRFIKMVIVACVGILSFMTIFKIGQEYIEFLPDGLPWVGHLDEAAAGVLFLKCLRYFEIDLTTLFDKS